MENKTKANKKKSDVKINQKPSVEQSVEPSGENITHKELWDGIVGNKDAMTEFTSKYRHIMNEIGTKLPCNRFLTGNILEELVANLAISSGYDVEHLPNAKRIDLIIKGYGGVSVKYNGSGDIRLHNSNGCINKDENVVTTLIVTPKSIYLIVIDELEKHNINIRDYIKNSGDSLNLKSKILKDVWKSNYPFKIDYDLNIDKNKCKNRECHKIVFEKLMEEYNKLKIS
mgnify:CR=1 FL=1